MNAAWRMRLLISVTSLALLALGACGGSGTVPPTDDGGGGGGGGGGGNGGAGDGTVAGSVTDGTGPVADAMVELTPTGTTKALATAPYATMTGANGAYSIDVPPGGYDLLIYKDVIYDDYAQTVTVDSGQTNTQSPVLVLAPSYVGSDTCTAICHAGKRATFERTGHPYKLNKIEGGAPPTYPFTNIDNVVLSLTDDGLPLPPDPDADPNGTETDNARGTPDSFFDVTYVVGGFGWKARFLDRDGYVVTGTGVQYNFFNPADGLWHWLDGGGKISGYHNNEVGKVYNCGNCHTTGWRRFDAALNPKRQDGLPGMEGTFHAPGVECEACHGAGSRHVVSMSTADITRYPTPRTLAQLTHHSAGYGLPVHCAECHTRDGERDYPNYVSKANGLGWSGDANWPPVGGRIEAKGGFVRHHEQYDEILGLDPNTLASTRSAAFAAAHGTCWTCHGSHHTTRFQDISGDSPGIRKDCTAAGCHSGSQYTNILHLTDTTTPGRPTHCIDCHMPLFSKSAQATYTPPAGPPAAVRPSEGDVRSHIFGIDLTKDPTTEQFTDGNGGYAFPYLTGRYACSRCHDSNYGVAPTLSFPSPVRIHGSP